MGGLIQAFGKPGIKVRLLVRRVRPTPGSQLALFTEFGYYPLVTDREGATLELEADHRAHARVETVIRDLKEGSGLRHLPSGRFAANAAWRGHLPCLPTVSSPGARSSQTWIGE